MDQTPVTESHRQYKDYDHYGQTDEDKFMTPMKREAGIAQSGFIEIGEPKGRKEVEKPAYLRKIRKECLGRDQVVQAVNKNSQIDKNEKKLDDKK